jgi:hypothetical protein
MWRSRSRAVLTGCIAAFLMCACGLVDLGIMEVDTVPSVDGEVIPANGPIQVTFSIEPERITAERIFKLSSPAGSQAGDFTWSGNVMSFHPVPPLKSGYRWTLSLEGTVKAADGRRFNLSESVEFFAGTDAPLIVLESCAPASGSTVSTEEPLVLTFSRAVNANLFRRCFTLNPSTEYDVDWSPDSRTVSIVPRKEWSTMTVYTWRVNEELADAEGVCLEQAYDGCFTVQDDAVPPFVNSVSPAIFEDGVFSPITAGLDELRWKDAIYVVFSEPMRPESVSSAIKLTPAVKGRIIQDGPAVFAFVPDGEFAARTTYRLMIGSESADLAGNTMLEDYTVWFDPDIADINVLGISINGGAMIIDFGSAFAYGFEPQLPDYSAVIAVEFNEPIQDASQRDKVVTIVTCSSLFPPTLSPALKSAQWIDDRRLELTYAGFKPSTASITYYYKLLVPGGASGVSDGAGGTMKDDVWIALFSD